VIKVFPLRVERVDKMYLSPAVTGFQLFFTGDGSISIFSNFVINELVDVVVTGKPPDQFLFVLVDSLDEVAGYSDIQSGICFIGEDVYVEVVISHIILKGKSLALWPL